jgi:hypothetical protein
MPFSDWFVSGTEDVGVNIDDINVKGVLTVGVREEVEGTLEALTVV